MYWVTGASCDSGEHEGGFWVAGDSDGTGDCDGGVFCGVSDTVVSPVQAAISASTRGVSRSPMTAAAPASATVGSFVGFSGAVVTDRRMGVVTHIPKAGDVNTDASYNSFSPLSV